MTKKILIMVSVVMLIALVGCSQETVEVATTTKPSTTITATTTTTTTEVLTTTTTQPQTTKDEITSTTKQTTTKQATTKPKPTTEKATTRKSTTTSYCKGKNDHWMPSVNVLNVASGQVIINTNNKRNNKYKEFAQQKCWANIFFAANDKSVPNTKVRDYFLCDKVLN